MSGSRDGNKRGAMRRRAWWTAAALAAACVGVYAIWLWAGQALQPQPQGPGTPGEARQEQPGGIADGAANGSGGAAGDLAGGGNGGGTGEGTGDGASSGDGTAPAGENGGAAEPAYDPDAFVTPEDLEKTYDIVIRNGRVINPETGLDREGLNVGIAGGTIGVVTSRPLKGERVIDATGLVVAPGFIDNLSYDPNPLGVWNKIADGVTSNIAMHGGTSTPKSWYAHYERNRTPVHFGASFFYTQARNQFRLSRYDSASRAQIDKLVKDAEEALNNGALGISFSLEYVPGISSDEILPLMKLAHEYNVPVYFHARYSDMEEPGTNIDALNEIIGYARATGAAVHIDHIHSTGGTFSMKQSLEMIARARAEGLDITACVYPYDFWGTYLNSARFDEGWQERFRIGYGDLQIAGTSERLTEKTFQKYRKEGKLAVAYAIPEQDVIDALQAEFVMIGSDAILEPGNNNHPRASGTFARTIGLYAREKGAITLMDAIAKMTLMPAQRLEKQAPAMRRKGRIDKGMDADIVVFDYETIRDRSTVERPDLTSEGIRYVLIGGRVVLDEDGLHKDVRVGEPIRSEFVRVPAETKEISLDGRIVPLVEYRGAHYFDLEALRTQGYDVTWDKLSRTYTVTAGGGSGDAGGASVGRADVPPPKRGELMLERGYKVVWQGGGETFNGELLSIGDRAYAPLALLKAMGWQVAEDGQGWRADRTGR